MVLETNVCCCRFRNNRGVYNKEKIIEIGMIKYDGSKVIDKFEALINPFVKIDPFIEKLTGIKNNELKNQKDLIITALMLIIF